MRRDTPPSSKELPETLWILRRPPDPKGPPESRAIWEMLIRAATKSRLRVMVEAPPIEWKTLQAALSGRGVSLMPGWSCDEEGFRRSLRAEIRGRRFAAIFVVGGESVRHWLPWAWQTAPAARVVAVLTEDRFRPAWPGAPRGAELDETRRALTQADETWCLDGKTLRAALSPARRSGPPAPVILPPETMWLHQVDERTSPSASKRSCWAAPTRAESRRRSNARHPAFRARAASRRAAKGSSPPSIRLFSSRAPLLWLCLDAFQTPDEALIATLTEGLSARPYAGGVMPSRAAQGRTLRRPLPGRLGHQP